MDHRLDRIEDKIDKIGDKIGAIDITLVAQHESLKHHIRRTEILEEIVKPIQPMLSLIKYLPVIGRFLIKVVMLVTSLGIFDQIVKRFL